MRIKQNILEIKDGGGTLNKYVTAKCDKCGSIGSYWIKYDETDLDDNKKICYCEQ